MRTGSTLEEAGIKFGVSREYVRQIFTKAGYKIRGQTISQKVIESRKNRPRKLISKELLEKLYVDEKRSIKYIIKNLKVDFTRVIRSLDAYGIVRRTAAEINLMQTKNPELTPQLLKKLYIEDDLSAPAIARQFGYPPATVQTRLSRLKIRKRDRTRV